MTCDVSEEEIRIVPKYSHDTVKVEGLGFLGQTDAPAVWPGLFCLPLIMPDCFTGACHVRHRPTALLCDKHKNPNRTMVTDSGLNVRHV